MWQRIRDRGTGTMYAARDALATLARLLGYFVGASFLIILTFALINKVVYWLPSLVGVVVVAGLFAWLMRMVVDVHREYRDSATKSKPSEAERERSRRSVAILLAPESPKDSVDAWFSPLVVSILIVLTAISIFSAGTYWLMDMGVAAFVPSCEGCTFPSVLMAFYAWHLVDTIPLLDLDGTLRWDAPLAYSSVAVGTLVILFKAAIVLPLIAAARHYLRVKSDAPVMRARPWISRRVAVVGENVEARWASRDAPIGYVFDIWIRRLAPSRSESATHNETNELKKSVAVMAGRVSPALPGTYRLHTRLRRLPDSPLPPENEAGEAELAVYVGRATHWSRPATIRIREAVPKRPSRGVGPAAETNDEQLERSEGAAPHAAADR